MASIPVATTAATTNAADAQKNYLQASLEVAKVELALAQQKVKQIENWIDTGLPSGSDVVTLAAKRASIRASFIVGGEGVADEAAAPKKKRKLVQYDEDGKVIKKAISGYNLYMTEMMKPVDKDGNKPKFGNVASGWKDLTDNDKVEWGNKAKAAVPKVAREEWIEVDDAPKKKRDKSGYNVYVSTLMKETDDDGNKKNIQEIAATWKELSDKDKEEWNEKALKEAEASAADAIAKEEAKAAKAAAALAKEEEKAAKKKAAASATAAKATAATKKKEATEQKKKKEEKPKKEKAPPKKKAPAKPKVDLVKIIKKDYINSQVAAYVEADENDPDDRDVWLPGKIISAERDEEDDSVIVEIKTVDKQSGEVEFPATQDKFPTDDCRLLSEDKDGVVYLHDPVDHKKKVEFYRACPASLKKNDTVFGQWGKSSAAWYRGRILKVDNKKPRKPCLIEFDDGDKKTFYSDKQGYNKVWLVNTKEIDKIKPKKTRI